MRLALLLVLLVLLVLLLLPGLYIVARGACCQFVLRYHVQVNLPASAMMGILLRLPQACSSSGAAAGVVAACFCCNSTGILATTTHKHA